MQTECIDGSFVFQHSPQAPEDRRSGARHRAQGLDLHGDRISLHGSLRRDLPQTQGTAAC